MASIHAQTATKENTAPVGHAASTAPTGAAACALDDDEEQRQAELDQFGAMKNGLLLLEKMRLLCSAWITLSRSLRSHISILPLPLFDFMK